MPDAPPALESFVLRAWRRTPRPSLRQIAFEVRERFDLPRFDHRGVARILARLEAAGPEDDPEAAVRPQFDDPAWLADVQARVRGEAIREFRGRHDPDRTRLVPVHALLRQAPRGGDGASLGRPRGPVAAARLMAVLAASAGRDSPA